MNKIAKIRKSKGLTQTQLAEQLNVSQTTLSCWETGFHEPDLNALISIAKILETSIDNLLGVSTSQMIVISIEEYEGLIKARDLISKIEKNNAEIKKEIEINDNHGKITINKK